MLAVKRPPDGDVPAKTLENTSLYITNESMEGWLRKQAGGASPNAPLTADTIAQFVPSGVRLLAALNRAAPSDPTSDAAQFWALIYATVTEEFFKGAYPATKDNALFALRAFILFHRVGLYPPTWILDWLNAAFLGYLESGGEKDLASLLGIKRGKGETPIFKEDTAFDVEAGMMQEIAWLNASGISVADAAAMVFGRCKRAKTKCPSGDTLAERFTKRGWRELVKLMKPLVQEIPAGDIKKYITETYPSHAIPARWK